MVCAAACYRRRAGGKMGRGMLSCTFHWRPASELQPMEDAIKPRFIHGHRPPLVRCAAIIISSFHLAVRAKPHLDSQHAVRISTCPAVAVLEIIAERGTGLPRASEQRLNLLEAHPGVNTHGVFDSDAGGMMVGDHQAPDDDAEGGQNTDADDRSLTFPHTYMVPRRLALGQPKSVPGNERLPIWRQDNIASPCPWCRRTRHLETPPEFRRRPFDVGPFEVRPL